MNSRNLHCGVGIVLKCQICGKDIDLPFKCSYCQGYFCVDHKLPENHQCPDLPEGPLFWYRKKTVAEREVLRDDALCPKCRASFVSVTSIEREKVNYQCRGCNHKWSEPRLITFSIPEDSKGRKRVKAKPSQSTSLSAKIFAIIIGSLISVGGFAIVLWELFNPFFWTIIFISFIPVPLILIGLGILIFGFLVAVAGALQK